jgi:flagellar biosynthesis activator protein FlaF
MHSATQAYAKAAQTTAGPRELEAQLLLRAASKLQSVQDGSVSDANGIDDALRYNRRLWSLLFTSISSVDNPMPHEIKQNLVNLAGFILKQTLSAEIEFEQGKIRPLIEINRNIAAGLRANAGESGANVPAA